VKLDIFSELQKGRGATPVGTSVRQWPAGAEAQLYADVLEQAAVADEFGYHCWWAVEHHGCGEFSMSSTPELMNVSIAHATDRLRIGHAGVLGPFQINHPIRVAERAAYLDVISKGRLEMGITRSSVNEWVNFEVDGEKTRQQMRELYTMLPKMWQQENFKWDSELLRVPEINVIPKPVQQPHPPLWQAGQSPEGVAFAGELGLGMVCTTLLSPLEFLTGLLQIYREGIARCEAPAGDFVNNQFANFTFVHCAGSREEAIRHNVGPAVLWYMNSCASVFRVPRNAILDIIRGAQVRQEDINWRQFGGQATVESDLDPDDPSPVVRLLNRQALGMEIDPVEAFEALEPLESVIIGDPDACLQKMKGFAELGVDRLLCFQAFGDLKQPDILESMRLIGTEVLPVIEG
jgi:alkanesulfonate monooxygenase SsuD/methylene tetrahydromethanopterin reductase-like flavin-dependent oxidoreductase (luciferase family)